MTDQSLSDRPSSAVIPTVLSAAGVVLAFVVAIVDFAQLLAHTITALHGFDSFLGVPSVAGSIIFFAAVLAWSVARFAGARYPFAPGIGAVVVASVGTLYQLIAVVQNPSWYSVILVLLAVSLLVLAIRDGRAAARGALASPVPGADRPKVLGVFLILAGVAGLTAAYNLSIDKVTAIVNPATSLNCDRSLIVQCSANLKSWEGSLFGFPNPLIGLGGFAVPIVLGIAVLAGVRIGRWYWVAFNLGVMGALALVIFLITSSVFVLGTLCLWCALVWTFTIPLFWLVTLYNLKSGNLRVSPRATRFFASAYSWIPLITLVCYLVVAGLYQLQLNALSYL